MKTILTCVLLAFSSCQHVGIKTTTDATITTVTTIVKPIVTSTTVKPKPINTSTTVKPKPINTSTTVKPVPPTLLSLAQEAVGHPAADFGCSEFWCACFVENLMVKLGWTDTDKLDSPTQLRNQLPVVTDPSPGDLVFFSFQAGTGQADHVAVVESLNPLVVIDGNGPYSRTNIARWAPDLEVVGYARVPR